MTTTASLPISLTHNSLDMIVKHNTPPILISDKYIAGWDDPNVDGLQLIGNSRYVVDNTMILRSGLDPKGADELSSGVTGADVVFYRCVFKDSGKGFLGGNGDTDTLDLLSGIRFIFYECMFDGISRRNPYFKRGQGYLIRSWIRNWGIPSTFHEKCSGVRVGSMAQAILHSCIFEQESFTTCLKRGNNFTDAIGNLKWPPTPLFGFQRAAFTDRGGQVQAYNCYRNRSWLSVEGHRGDFMSHSDMLLLKAHLAMVLPSAPDQV